MLSIHNISVSVGDRIILNNITLDFKEGTISVLMGPNGSGKSSLANVLAGNPEYQCLNGTITMDGEDILSLPVHERALKGLFVAFQHVPAIPGLSIFTFLKEALYARTNAHLDVLELEKQIFEHMDFLGLARSFLYRSMHDSFSGGEQKRFELLQLLVLKPRCIIFDEIDSGLDIDALALVKKVIDVLYNENSALIVVCITHYSRMVRSLQPSRVHVLHQGAVVTSGDLTVADQIEAYGYQHYAQ